MTAEHRRLEAQQSGDADWQHWGPYLAERAWGTVREDYSEWGKTWDFFPHDHARSRAYRWNEDGIAGISDRNQHICFALSMWNGRDTMLKERMFGLSGSQGNHGEDVKEMYYYLDNMPSHSYMKMLYKYPQRPFPYARLVGVNRRRTTNEFEYELMDTGIFKDNRYFDVLVEYAKVDTNDILIQITAVNRGDRKAPLFLLPTLWFRNTWSWGYPTGPHDEVEEKPLLRQLDPTGNVKVAEVWHPATGTYYLYAEHAAELLFTENNTNSRRLYGLQNESQYVKDAFHRYVVDSDRSAVNPAREGTKCAAMYFRPLNPGEEVSIRLRISPKEYSRPFVNFNTVFQQRLNEVGEFYSAVQRPDLGEEARSVQRQALAGLLWSKQFYYLDMPQWFVGDPVHPVQRKYSRNEKWLHYSVHHILSMPDKWEYPYATWETAFQVVPLTMLDSHYAKQQLRLLTQANMMHPNGQFPAYEWDFQDVNPPIHAWATLRVYQLDAEKTGQPDRRFLEEMFHKLMLNYAWWINRTDRSGDDVFSGGFLGLDNISLFDRTTPLPGGGYLEQSDSVFWMGFYSIEMMKIALELARENSVYEELAARFYDHFLRIAEVLTNAAGRLPYTMWDEEDGFFYDALRQPDGSITPLKARSIAGLMPLLAVEALDADLQKRMPRFAAHVERLLRERPYMHGNISFGFSEGQRVHLLAMLNKARLQRVLQIMLDENEFLSPYGIRSLSRFHKAHPIEMNFEDVRYAVNYVPAESDNRVFGGNDNWRGPIWFPVNYLLIEALRRYDAFYGDALKVEFPTGSGEEMTLGQVADALSRRMIALFMPNERGARPMNGAQHIFNYDDYWRDYVFFFEYFNGDDGAGLGASHQTGWTSLVAMLLQQVGG